MKQQQAAEAARKRDMDEQRAKAAAHNAAQKVSGTNENKGGGGAQLGKTAVIQSKTPAVNPD